MKNRLIEAANELQAIAAEFIEKEQPVISWLTDDYKAVVRNIREETGIDLEGETPSTALQHLYMEYKDARDEYREEDHDEDEAPVLRDRDRGERARRLVDEQLVTARQRIEIAREEMRVNQEAWLNNLAIFEVPQDNQEDISF